MATNEATVFIDLNNEKMKYKISKNLKKKGQAPFSTKDLARFKW